jgi:hypothetical protein
VAVHLVPRENLEVVFQLSPLLRFPDPETKEEEELKKKTKNNIKLIPPIFFCHDTTIIIQNIYPLTSTSKFSFNAKSDVFIFLQITTTTLMLFYKGIFFVISPKL